MKPNLRISERRAARAMRAARALSERIGRHLEAAGRDFERRLLEWPEWMQPVGPGALSDTIVAEHKTRSFFRPAVPKLQLAPWLVLEFDSSEERTLAAATQARREHLAGVPKPVLRLPRTEPDLLPDGRHALACRCFDCIYSGRKAEKSWIE